ncbi:hypothetical protein [Streptosporangium carneum]|uniref:Secreted protein n=1 Tax=Streptosporangium carneum TaxID=47481 RepID=A0A9W6MAR5_9ACTN|nr:hypothetical protein [Streptosporangium carneum]GLK07331.1 hypothetical protein GCM10017600_07360 [Streptosporangium carneum]
MKVRQLSAAALLAATLGAAALAGAAPAAAISPESPPGVTYGPYSTVDSCKVDRDLVVQRYGSYFYVTPCQVGPDGYYWFKRVFTV